MTLIVDGTAQQDPDRYVWPVGESTERLDVAFNALIDQLQEIAPNQLAILLPERGPRVRWQYSAIAPRVAMETLLRLAAVRGKIPVAMIDRQTVRSNLGIKGNLDGHLGVVLKAGKYWGDGRGLAALAAITAGNV